jgi:hypothetical protein
MTIVTTRIRVAPDGTISGRIPAVVLPGEHEAEIILHPEVPAPEVEIETLAAIRQIQDELARLPILDPRSPDDIIGYDERGLFR